MPARNLIIYGAGGFAREVAWLAEQALESGGLLVPVCFADDDSELWGTTANELPVLSLDDAVTRHSGATFAVGVGDPTVRRAMATKAEAAGIEAVVLLHPRIEKSRWIEIGAGSIVCAGVVLTTNIRLGRHVHVNLDCTIGHDVVIHDFVTLAPGAHVSGYVEIGQGAYIGTGAVIINGDSRKRLLIGAGAVVGAGACVTRDAEPGITIGGVPAKPLKR